METMDVTEDSWTTVSNMSKNTESLTKTNTNTPPELEDARRTKDPSLFPDGLMSLKEMLTN